ncbi:MAG: tRNA pseudouridine(55) synthase TruB [Nitrospinae bacterium CG11_big_fil_rev_8_21_14_0_20_56_8]|nr:MAG: tRNA pseudouridine(55) synthase TruB [Nitrospinae bacterium CG11_big_fil_rev_8_21_14_0_20_56_8]
MTSTLNKVVNLYKPAGPTSFDMVWSVKKILGVEKAGHIGTLDPDAEGMLPICLNRSTRIIQFLSSQSKIYLAGMELGKATDTQDASGKVIAEADPGGITEKDLIEVMQGMMGRQKQVPPMFSAKKKNGIPLYKLARNGITIERKPVAITLFSLKFTQKDGNRVFFEVHCSSGTYVRTLCHDIGEKLGCHAHLFRLVRTQVGVFDKTSSLTLETLKSASQDGSLSGRLISQEQALEFLPAIQIDPEHTPSVANGVGISRSVLKSAPGRFARGDFFRISDSQGKMVAVAESLVDSEMLANLPPRQIAFKLKRVLL